MAGEFKLALEAFAKKAGDRADAVVSTVVQDVVREIDGRSPVGKAERWAANIERAKRGKPPLPAGYVGGRFRGNWQLGVDELIGTEIDRTDATGTGTVAANIAGLPAAAASHNYFLSNNLPYAQRLESGHSKQAPPGFMVGGTVLKFTQIVNDAVADAKAAHP